MPLKKAIVAKAKVFKALKYKLYQIKQKLKSLFYNNSSPKHGWFGNYTSWELAADECSGYDAAEILNKTMASVLRVKRGEAVYERDSVLFDEIQYSEPLHMAFQKSNSNNQLHIVDFGGALGSTYFQNIARFSANTEIKWSVVEQKHLVEAGKKEIAGKQLNFFDTIDEALEQQEKHVLLMSSVIPYFKEPYALIEKALSYGFEFIIIDRTAFIENRPERITKQIVPEFIYKASYPAWFLNEHNFVKAFSGQYDLIFDFMSAFDPVEFLEDGAKVYRKGFYFKRKMQYA